MGLVLGTNASGIDIAVTWLERLWLFLHHARVASRLEFRMAN